MNEKREHKRVNLIYYLEILDRETGESLGNLVDISKGGFMMIGEQQMKAGREFQFTMRLPETAFGDKAITVKASSCWSKSDVNPAFFASGYQFEDMGEVEEKTVEFLIDNFSFNGSGS